jgi:hypothetical protein
VCRTPLMKAQWLIAGIALATVGGCASRPWIGRRRPDLAAILSFDDGIPLTFARTYTEGEVGPFTIGESRRATRERLATLPLLDQDRGQLTGEASSWSVALPAKSGGYSIYTLKFASGHVLSVRAFYSMFAGL